MSSPKFCKFFFSTQGCRDGAHCKFLHIPSPEAKMGLPCTVLAVDIETTGCWIGVHKIVAIGTALFRLTPQLEVVEIESKVFKFKVDYPADFDDVTLKDFWHVDDRMSLLAELQREASDEAEAIAQFYEYYTSVCLRFPGFYLLSDNVSMDISFVNLSLATLLHKPPLIFRPAPPSGPNEQPSFTNPHFPVDANSFACGLIGLHFPPYRKEAGTRWACPSDFLKYHKPCLYCPYIKTHSPDDDAKFVAWQFLQCISILWDQEQAFAEAKKQDEALELAELRNSPPSPYSGFSVHLPHSPTKPIPIQTDPVGIGHHDRIGKKNRSASETVVNIKVPLQVTLSSTGTMGNKQSPASSPGVSAVEDKEDRDKSNPASPEYSPGRKRNRGSRGKKWNRKNGRAEASSIISFVYPTNATTLHGHRPMAFI